MGLFIKTKEELYQKAVEEINKKNYSKAIKLLTKATEKESADAWYMLGRVYEEAWGVPKDAEKALECYDKAASLGSVKGKEKADYCRAEKLGLKGFQLYQEEQWEESRAIWLEMIEKYDIPVAYYNLGIMYEDGKACEQSDAEAKKCFQNTVEKGMTSAIEKIIFHSENEEEKFHGRKNFMKICGDLANAGFDGTRFVDKALKWLQIAKNRGETSTVRSAAGHMTSIKKKMNIL